MEIRKVRVSGIMSGEDHFYVGATTLKRRVPSYLIAEDVCKVVLITAGTVDHYVSGDIMRLHAGHLVFLRPDDAHGFRCVSEEPAHAETVVFRKELAEEICARHLDTFGQHYFWAKQAHPETYLLGDRAHAAIAAGFGDLRRSARTMAVIEAFLLSLLTRVNALPRMTDPDTPDWLSLACQAARDPEVFRDGASGFVRAAGRGHEHVSRSTRRYIGASPSAYVNEQRMNYAASMLVGSDQSIQDICTDCGIENLSHFYRLFRAQLGDTPRRYRERFRRDPLSGV